MVAQGVERVEDRCTGRGRVTAGRRDAGPGSRVQRDHVRAHLHQQGGDTAAARAAILDGLHALSDHLPESGFHDQPSVQMLQSLQDALTPRLPASQRVELQTRLQLAIDCENFELAAILRDELRQLPD